AETRRHAGRSVLPRRDRDAEDQAGRPRNPAAVRGDREADGEGTRAEVLICGKLKSRRRFGRFSLYLSSRERHHIVVARPVKSMTSENTKTLPLLSLRNLVLFPGAVMPVEIGRPSSLRLIEALGGKGARVLVGTQKGADSEERAGADLYAIWVEGGWARSVKAAENRVTAVLRGLERRRVTSFVQERPYLVAAYEPLAELRKDPIEIDGLGMAVYDVAK